MHSTLTFEHVCQVEQIRCVLNLPLPSEDEQGSDSSASQGSKGKESSSTKSSQASSALEHPHQGHHAIDALNLDIQECRAKCRWLELKHNDDIEVCVSQRGRICCSPGLRLLFVRTLTPLRPKSE